ncbi:hypothetical protein Hsc_1195 [Herbaspirillum seropedicae]|nr:hypothetical protein Hsc_1195 [Herbaspirillum seropedicae]
MTQTCHLRAGHHFLQESIPGAIKQLGKGRRLGLEGFPDSSVAALVSQLTGTGILHSLHRKYDIFC